MGMSRRTLMSRRRRPTVGALGMPTLLSRRRRPTLGALGMPTVLSALGTRGMRPTLRGWRQMLAPPRDLGSWGQPWRGPSRHRPSWRGRSREPGFVRAGFVPQG